MTIQQPLYSSVSVRARLPMCMFFFFLVMRFEGLALYPSPISTISKVVYK
jgi:hypothetical protein